MLEHKVNQAVPVLASENNEIDLASSALLSRTSLDSLSSKEMMTEQMTLPCARKSGFFSFLGPKPMHNGKNQAIKITSTPPSNRIKDGSLEAILGSEFTC